MGMAIKPRLTSERKPIIVQAEMIKRSRERVLKEWRFFVDKDASQTNVGFRW